MLLHDPRLPTCFSADFMYFPDTTDDGDLLCACKNDKGTCKNEMCRGNYCFYNWVKDGYEELGCFSENTKVQCYSSLPNYFTQCCREDYCNSKITVPPNISQYLKPFLFNTGTSHYPRNQELVCPCKSCFCLISVGPLAHLHSSVNI